MKSFGPVLLLARTVLQLLGTAVHAASFANYYTLQQMTAIADRVETSTHSRNTKVA